MKKVLAVVLGLLVAAPVLAGDFGLGVKAGVTSKNPTFLTSANDMQSIQGEDGTSINLYTPTHFWGVEGMYEYALNDNGNKIGLKVGWEKRAKNELSSWSEDGEHLDMIEKSQLIPLTLYFKKENGVKNFSYLVGVGATYMKNKMTATQEGEDFKITGHKWFAHLTVGTEYLFTEHLALGFDVKYNINAKFKKSPQEDVPGLVFGDYSGLSAALAARYYF